MAKRKKSKTFNLNAAIRAALRRLFARSPAVRECMLKVRREVPKYNKDGKKAKRPAVQYLCATCKKWVGSTRVSVDHTEPVVSVEGFVDWNVFIERLFCDDQNLAVLCDTCHQKKTNAERIQRTSAKYMLELQALEASFIHAYQRRIPKNHPPGIPLETWPVDPVFKTNITSAEHKRINKELGRYIAKKKTAGLEKVADRAAKLRALLLTLQPK